MIDFVHLQLQSEYSLLNSNCRIKGVVKQAKELGYHTLAITDEQTMYGAIHFYKACKKEGIKPIIGLTLKIKNQDGTKVFPMVFLSKNEQGYENLIKLSSAANTTYEEGVPFAVLVAYKEGLIAISPGIKGEIEQALLNGHIALAKDVINQYKSNFEYFYLSIQDHGLMEEIRLHVLLEEVGGECNIPLVVTHNVHYFKKDDAKIHDSLQAIKNGTKLEEAAEHILGSNEFYLTSTEEMVQRFGDRKEYIQNTIEIANLCNVTILLDQQHLPIFPLKIDRSAKEVLREQCIRGLMKYEKENEARYIKRLDDELEIIHKMGFDDYFLIVGDFMNYAHEKGILTGPGRGSAAGSLVSYLLSITNVDPIQYDLLFERFLNPSRITLPDIDIDFPDYRRDEMIEYVVKKYGQLRVAQIVTFGTLAAKAAIRDVARIHGILPKDIDRLSKQIPSRLGITLKEAYEESDSLRTFLGQSHIYKEIYEVAQKIEGLPRHTSTHAAGVIMSDKKLTAYTPLQKGNGETYTTQYDGPSLEQLGLLKMDFLGLRNLTLLEEILTSINKSEEGFSLKSISLHDKKTFQLLGRGDTTGIFQLESSGMRKVLQSLKPTELEDIVAVNALYRPGPSQQIPTYIERKHGKAKPEYLHPDLEPILKRTYGVIIYQEQIMQIAYKLAGFSLAQADLLRRAVSKKDKEILDKERKHFVQGCVNQGYKKDVGDKVYDLIVRFANYGFNRSHAVAYSMIGYQLAYLKAHYPLHFYCSLLTSVIGHEQKVYQYISEAKQRGIQLLPPSIHKSGLYFQIEEKGIRYPLAAIKGIGQSIAKEIVERRKKGLYKDMFDFTMRVPLKMRTNKILETFVLAGVFDEFNKSRATMFGTIEVALEYASLIGGDDENQIDLFEDDLVPKPKYIESQEWSKEEKLQKEKEVIGFYLTEHPTSAFIHLIQEIPIIYISELDQYVNEEKYVFVYISEMKRIQTKKKQPMAFFTLSDQSGEVDAVAFPGVFSSHSFIEGKMYYLRCKVEKKDESIQLIIEDAFTIPQLKEWLSFKGCTLYLRISSENENRKLIQLKQLLRRNPGWARVIVVEEKTKRVIALTDEYNIHPGDPFLVQLKQLLGEKNVALKNE